MRDATDPKLQTSWEVPLPTKDFAAAALHRVQEAYFKAYGDDARHDPSLIWRVYRKPT